MTFKMRVAILSLFTTLFFAVAQFFPLSLYSVTSLTTLTKRTLATYSPVLFSPSTPSALDDDSATYLPDIIQAATTNCQAKCHAVSRTLAGCLRSGADYDILKCSCSDVTLARVYTCANCIAIDASNQNGTLPLQNYNAFVNQCISLSLSNSSQLYQIKGQPLTIAHPTTTLSNPSATAGASAAEATDEGDIEGEIEEGEFVDEAEFVTSGAGRSMRTVDGGVVLGVSVVAVVAIESGLLTLL